MAGLDRGRRYALKKKRHAAGGFYPVQVSAVSAWLRLQASSQSAGAWTNWVDVLNANPAGGSNMPNVGAASGLPTAVFASGPDVVRWPVINANNGAGSYGFWLRIKPTTTGNQYLMTCDPDTGGASARKMLFQITTGGVIIISLFFAGTSRVYTSGAGAITTASQAVGFTYDIAGATEADKFKMFVGSSYIASTPSGAGVPGVLPTPTGNILIGDFRDSGVAGQPFVGQIGPNIFSLSRHLTTGELANLNAFEAFV